MPVIGKISGGGSGSPDRASHARQVSPGKSVQASQPDVNSLFSFVSFPFRLTLFPASQRKENWKRNSKDDPTPADLDFGIISNEPNNGTVITSEQEDKQEEDNDRSPVSRPNLSDNTRNILDEIMQEDLQADCELPKQQRERASRPNKRKSTSWKKSSV